MVTNQAAYALAQAKDAAHFARQEVASVLKGQLAATVEPSVSLFDSCNSISTKLLGVAIYVPNIFAGVAISALALVASCLWAIRAALAFTLVAPTRDTV